MEWDVEGAYQGSRMKRDPHHSMHSSHPYGVRKFLVDLIPGFRYAPPWAIFVSSLREDCA